MGQKQGQRGLRPLAGTNQGSGCCSLGARMHAGEVWALAALGTRTGTSRTLATLTQGTSAGAEEG